MNFADNAVISLSIVGVALLLPWLAFKVVALAFGWIAVNARGRQNIAEDKQETGKRTPRS
jgi:hypothetical protein